MPGNSTNPDKQLLNQLQHILLKDDRAVLSEIQDTINDPELLKTKVNPILEERLAVLKEEFPKEYQRTIDQLIEKKLKASQEEILDVIYPVMGKMIRKYINHQIQMVKDNIDATIKNTFSKQGLFGRLRNMLFGIKPSDQILHSLKNYKIEEIYVTQKDSGLLFGMASTGNTIDQDAIAGMLTAIKSFVEDAFKKEQQNLGLIEYDTYKILLQNFYSYYIAVAISGTLSSSERDVLSNNLYDFAEQHLRLLPSQPDEAIFAKVSDALKASFFE